MPTFKDRMVFEVARGIKAFLNLEVGITRSKPPQEEGSNYGNSPVQPQTGRVNPKNVVWIFCTGRSGSTWLSNMMGDFEGSSVWPEPLIGAIFGGYYYREATEAHRRSPWFALGGPPERWVPSIRAFFLEGVRTRFPDLDPENILVIKETGGSMGAPLVTKALPESRMLMLVRDPRDVVASSIDAMKKESWGAEVLGEDTPNFDAGEWAERYRLAVEKGMEAYEAHEGRKSLVLYEDLRSDAFGTMRRLCSELGLPVNDAELKRTVEKHSWENVPRESKGEGKFHRKAKPGGWKEDLTPEQIETVERITAPVLKEFYT